MADSSLHLYSPPDMTLWEGRVDALTPRAALRWHQVVESLDGYTLIRDPQTGWVCYADVNAAGDEFVSTQGFLGLSTLFEG